MDRYRYEYMWYRSITKKTVGAFRAYGSPYKQIAPCGRVARHAARRAVSDSSRFGLAQRASGLGCTVHSVHVVETANERWRGEGTTSGLFG